MSNQIEKLIEELSEHSKNLATACENIIEFDQLSQLKYKHKNHAKI